MKVLVVDIGGTNIKILASGRRHARKLPSGPTMTAHKMVSGVITTAQGWDYDVVSIGYPGPVLHGAPLSEPHNLGSGWVGFDFRRAFHRPVKVINDAAMQAIGSYKERKLLFLGLGTGLGSTLIIDGIVAPLELGHLPYKNATYEDYVGVRGLKKFGVKKWRRYVADIVARLIAALQPDDVVLGGGNVKKLKTLPPGCRAGANPNAFLGGFRLWENGRTPKLRLSESSLPNSNRKRQGQKREKSHRIARTTQRDSVMA
jgi:polyphosphate glucokinase